MAEPTLQEQIAAVKAAEASVLPPASAGQVIAQDNSAGVQNPAQPASVIAADGRINANNVESGTNAPVVTITDSQATPTGNTTPIIQAADTNRDTTGTIVDVAAPTTQPGAGAGTGTGTNIVGADAATPNSTKQTVDNVFGSAGPIVPQPNVLAKYASYTYQASFYLMKPEAFNAMVKSRKKNLAGAQLLFQSGGAPVTGRNQYFSNDYYIDRIELKSTIAGKGSGLSHNVNTVKMTVVEPNGITMMENLDKAVQSYLGSTGNPPKRKAWQSQLFLLVIKFYGYDDNGKLVQAGQTASGATTASPAAAMVEKYYPLALNNVKFKIANKLVEYEFEASAIQYQTATGQLRAAIPYNIELSSGTLRDAFNGAAVVGATTTTSSTATANTTPRDETTSTSGTPAGTPAPQTAASAPTPKLTVRQGIVQALNQFQQEKVKSGEITYPDVYSVEFVTDAVANAQIKKVGQDKKASPPPAGGTAADQVDPAKQSVDKTTRLLSITAGVPMVQVIDQLLKNSTYIEDQQLVKVLENSGVQVPNGAPAKNLAWYKITMESTPGKYDPKRNDYAYNIKYIIHPYKINDMVSNYFTTPKYNGVHKQYNYWFTGLNNEVLQYEQTYNALYAQVISGNAPNPNAQQQDQVKMIPATRSGQSSQGAKGRANEAAANAADYLYSPGDNTTCDMTIVGDPGWLQQGEVAFGVDTKNFNFGGFLPDGTINFESQQVLFEVLFNLPGDYNLSTGLMDPNAKSSVTNQTQPSGQKPGSSRKSFIFIATECTSVFSKGKFTQQLKGSRINYFGDQTQKDAANARPTGNAVSTGNATGTGSRPTNASTGPQGQNSIPTNQPSAGTNTQAISSTPPDAGTSTDADAQQGGFYGNPTPTSTSAGTTEAPPQPLPATPITPRVDSTGDIVPANSVTTAATAPDEKIAAVQSAAVALPGLDVPAPPRLPSADATQAFEAKLNQLSADQVNTNPPQLIDKSDQ